MIYIKILFLFLFGLAIGSFINVVVYRINTPDGLHPRGEVCGHPGGVLGVLRILGGRSFCPKCKHKLNWQDNIPLLSFVLLKGKCRYCHSPISWQYPAVEAATGLLFAFTFYWSYFINDFTFLVAGYWLLITSILITIFVSDLLYQTIPDHFTYPGIAICLVYILLNRQFFNLLTGLGAVLFFAFLHWVTHGKGMAIGDVKLALFLGLFLGWPEAVICFYFAFLTGAILGGILILIKKLHFGQKIAFGPFLCLGGLVALFWGEKILSFYYNLF